MKRSYPIPALPFLFMLLMLPAMVQAQGRGGGSEPIPEGQAELQYDYDTNAIRNMSQDEWLELSTDDRLRALSGVVSHEENQTYFGRFGRYYQMYEKWGYEYYEMEDRYESYAFRGFENYNILDNRRNRWSYNQFGERITRLGSAATLWSEYHNGDGTFSARGPGSYINSASSNGADGVWVAQESTEDWAFSVIGSGMLRTKFTPLTFSMPNMNGTRIDFQSANNQISLATSVVKSASLSGSPPQGIMFRGGYIRRKIGALTLGAAYANMYSNFPTREGSNTWYGSVTDYMPTPPLVAIRFVDDSPTDGVGGPIIYDVKIKINGRERPELVPTAFIDNLERDKVTAVSYPAEAKYINPQISTGVASVDEDALNIYETLPKYVDYVYLSDYQQGHTMDYSHFNLDLAAEYYKPVNPGELPIQVNGQEYLVFLYDTTPIGEKIDRIEIETLIANDYRIQTSQIFPYRPGQDGLATSDNIEAWYKSTYWVTRAQADGNIKDGSNLGRVTVDIGYQVATINYGFNADFNYLGLKIRGEYVTNANHYMFSDGHAGDGEPTSVASNLPARTGHRWAQLDNAWYVVAQKDWNMFGVAGEVFKMGKFYKPWLTYHMSSQVASQFGQRDMTVKIPLIEDNDDDDVYPDTNWEIRDVGGINRQSYLDPDGVFPGNDADHDGIADNNKNLNSVPDFNENFLMFDVDPDEFVFGDDFNNNTIPDFREDDSKYDTPYDLDRRGHHFNLRFTPVQSVNLIVGSFKTSGVGLSTRTNDDYFKLNLDYDVFSVGRMYAEYRYEEIQDNVRDVYFKVYTHMSDWGDADALGRFDRSLYYDELEYRNSKVNRLFLQSIIRAVPSITLENHIRLEQNKQVEGSMYDGTYQPYDELNTLAMVNKVIYTRQWGNFVFSPGIKFRLYKKGRSESLQPLDHYMLRIPMIMFKYIVSDRTSLTLGLQGVQGLQLHYKDYVQPENDYQTKNYLFQIENLSDYFGYQIWTGMGFRLDQVDYLSKFREFENYKSSQFFIRMLCGWS